MASLKMEKFHCVEDTDGWGFDSPYFLTCVADFTSRSVHVKLTRKTFWHDKVGKAEVWPVDDIIVNDLALAPAGTLVLAVMLEPGRGGAAAGNCSVGNAGNAGLSTIDSAAVSGLQKRMQACLQSLLQAGLGCHSATAVDTLSLCLQLAVEAALPKSPSSAPQPERSGPAVRVVHLSGAAGLLSPVSFPGDTGLYKVWYRQLP